MKRKSIRNLLAVVLVALAILLSACGSKKTEENTEDESTMNEDVQLSNIRFSDMKLTAEEKKMMQDVQELLQSAEVVWASEQYDNDILKIENTTPYTLDIEFVMNCYSADGELLNWNSVFLEDWKPGERLETGLSYNSGEPSERAELMAEYVYEGSYYRTDPLPLEITRAEKEIPVTLSVKGGLPQKISVHNYSGDSVFELTSFEYVPEEYSDDRYDFVLYFTKSSGKAQGYESMEYRIIRDDGVVANSDSIYFSYIRPGETVRVAENYIDLPPGTYTVEFISAN